MSDEPQARLDDETASRTAAEPGRRAETVTAVDEPAAEDLPPAGSVSADPAPVDTADGDRAWADPAWADPAGADPAGADPAGADPGGADLTGADLAEAEAPERSAAEGRSGRRGSAVDSGRPMLVLCAAFGVLVVALAVIAVKLGLGLAAQQREQDDQQAALHAARQAAADLMTVSYKSASRDMDRIQGVATGSFRAQVTADRKQLINETMNAHAVSTANVLAAGIVGGQVSGNTATVIVVVDSTITSKNAPNGVVNHYRETITLTRSGGRWLASQVDFATPGNGQ